jgi:hypothetical protein
MDHLAIDLKRKWLFVAELGSDSLGVVNLVAGKVLRTITGLSEPQGIGYEPITDAVYVANGSDGSVRILRGEDLAAVGRIDLSDDADDVRIDADRKRVLVGYGAGAVAIIDPTIRTKVGDIRLKAHPESFQIDGDRVFVNVPDARLIEVADLTDGEVVGAWSTQPNHSNFPMAMDREAHRLFVVFRSPARLVVMSAADGGVVGSLDACGDADDVFVDTKRHRVYVTCGAGVVDVFEYRGGSYQRVGQIPTVSGARTSLFVPELDRLFVAVRSSGNGPASGLVDGVPRSDTFWGHSRRPIRRSSKLCATR